MYRVYKSTLALSADRLLEMPSGESVSSSDPSEPVPAALRPRGAGRRAAAECGGEKKTRCAHYARRSARVLLRSSLAEAALHSTRSERVFHPLR